MQRNMVHVYIYTIILLKGNNNKLGLKRSLGGCIKPNISNANSKFK